MEPIKFTLCPYCTECPEIEITGCAAARNRGTCDNRLNMRLDRLETMILDGLRNRLMAPELFKTFCEEFHRELNRLRIEGNAEIDFKRQDLERTERRIRRIIELITEDDVPVRALKEAAQIARGVGGERDAGTAPAPEPRRSLPAAD